MRKLTPRLDYTNHALPLNKQVNVFILMFNKRANCKSNMGVGRVLHSRMTVPSQPNKTCFNASNYNIYPQHETLKNLRMLLLI